ncbi:MAG: lysophospholipid acyltransferase family protein, partial [Terriglobales bacterium]
SSSRGAVRALLGMHKVIDAGRTVAFSIDGPRGPKYVAKPGPVLLARNTGVPVMCFHIALENPWILPSWDDFMIPKPFSRALVRIGKLIHVPEEADSATLERYHADVQATLDRIREFAEAEVQVAGRRR